MFESQLFAKQVSCPPLEVSDHPCLVSHSGWSGAAAGSEFCIYEKSVLYTKPKCIF